MLFRVHKAVEIANGPCSFPLLFSKFNFGDVAIMAASFSFISWLMYMLNVDLQTVYDFLLSFSRYHMMFLAVAGFFSLSFAITSSIFHFNIVKNWRLQLEKKKRFLKPLEVLIKGKGNYLQASYRQIELLFIYLVHFTYWNMLLCYVDGRAALDELVWCAIHIFNAFHLKVFYQLYKTVKQVGLSSTRMLTSEMHHCMFAPSICCH